MPDSPRPAMRATTSGAGPAREAGQLVIEVSAPFRLDLAAWALRRRPHNEVDRFDGQRYRRVLPLAGEPAEVIVRQRDRVGAPVLIAELRGPAAPSRRTAAVVRPVLERMLGLAADLTGFYELAARDDRLRPLVMRFRGMRPPCFPTVFEAVVNAVACQQLSLDVGIHLLNRLARRFGPAVPRTGDGDDRVYGFPAPDRLAAADPAELRALGFSGAKARTITTIAAKAAAGTLDLEALRGADDDSARELLLSLPGIGRWSAEYVMLRGLARYHLLPGDDVGARNNLRRRFGLPEGAGYDAVARLSRRWWPYGGLVYFHLLLDALAARGEVEETDGAVG